MPKPEEIASLVKALGKGSVEAFDRLYLQFRPKVERVVGAIIGGVIIRRSRTLSRTSS